MSALDTGAILLVEDNPRDAELTLRAFRKANLANSILVAHDGVEALDLVHSRLGADRPRVILLDLKLPKLDGLEVLRRLKSDEHTRSIPVVVVTSSNQDPDIKTAYDLGANSYVVKPVDFESFMRTMSQLGFYWLMVNQVSA
jgi:two-component system, response regulator